MYNCSNDETKFDKHYPGGGTVDTGDFYGALDFSSAQKNLLPSQAYEFESRPGYQIQEPLSKDYLGKSSLDVFCSF